jgi:hypothetical protein
MDLKIASVVAAGSPNISRMRIVANYCHRRGRLRRSVAERALHGEQRGDRRAAAAGTVGAPSAAKHAFAILAQDLEIDNSINIKSKGRVQLPNSAALAAVTRTSLTLDKNRPSIARAAG